MFLIKAPSSVICTPNGHEDREGYGEVVVEEMGDFDSLTIQNLKMAGITSWTHQEVFSVLTYPVPGKMISQTMIT